MAARFDYHAPHSWDEAVALLAEHGSDARVLAGGTDLMILIERGEISPRHVVSLARLPHWDELRVDSDVTLSAGTTYRQLERSPELRGEHAALVEAARQIGGIQIRNVATVAGNLCNASPAADAVPPLLVMDASLRLYGPNGERVVAVHEFITDPNRTVLGEAELLREITVPAFPESTATRFLKAGRRAAMEISVVCVAARLTVERESHRCLVARIALGAVGSTPLRAVAAEQALQGGALTRTAIAEAAELAVEAARPIDDVRASAEYRRHLTRRMVQRALEDCHTRIAEGLPL